MHQKTKMYKKTNSNCNKTHRLSGRGSYIKIHLFKRGNRYFHVFTDTRHGLGTFPH